MDLVTHRTSGPRDAASDIIRDQDVRLSIGSTSLVQWAKSQLSVMPPVSFQSPEAAIIEEEIRNNNMQVLRLLDRISDIQESTCRLRATNSPVRRLPPEILGRAFEELREISSSQFAFNGAHLHHPSILKVCHRWRQVALATPALWSQIVLPNLHRGLMYSQPLPVKQLAEYTNLSGATPLDITVDEASFYASENAMLPLVRRAQSWRNCVFNHVRSDALEYLFSSSHTYMNLESLTLASLRVEPLSIAVKNGFVMNTPKLQELTCNGAFLFFIPYLRAPKLWRLQINNATVTNNLANCLPIAFPALTSLEFWSCAWNCKASPELPFLETFRCIDSEDIDLGFLLNCPRLGTIHLNNEEPPIAPSPLPAVTKLSVVTHGFTFPTDARTFFNSFPNLRRLEAESQQADLLLCGLVKNRSSDQGNADPPCNLLESITLRHCSFSWSQLLELVKDRTQHLRCETACGSCGTCSTIKGLQVSLQRCARADDIELAGYDELLKHYEENDTSDDEEDYYGWGHSPNGYADGYPGIFEDDSDIDDLDVYGIHGWD